VLDREGVAIDSWGRGDIIDAHGLHITKSDELLAVDRDGHRVVKFTLAGDIVMVLGGQPSWQAPFNHPTDVAVGPTGDIYVTDGYCNSSVHRFSAAGELVDSWGQPGSGDGEFRVPHGIWVDDEHVYVADRDNNRVQLLTLSGEFVEAWTDFYRPTDVFIDRTGHIFVTELIPRVSVFDGSGRLVARLRPANNNAHGVWADSQGDLYVAPTDGRSVEKFVRAHSAATDGG
jgi:peptidylglycine monooxygenase